MLVHAASEHDSRGAQPLLPACQQVRLVWASPLQTVLTDSEYRGRFAHQVRALGWCHQVPSRPPTAASCYVPIAKRWVVERTFAWLNYFRRLVFNYEHPCQPRRVAQVYQPL